MNAWLAYLEEGSDILGGRTNQIPKLLEFFQILVDEQMYRYN